MLGEKGELGSYQAHFPFYKGCQIFNITQLFAYLKKEFFFSFSPNQSKYPLSIVIPI